MAHMNKTLFKLVRYILMTFVIAFGLCTIIATGGGGGDDTSNPSLTYTGLSTPVLITEYNAGVISANSLEYGSSGTALSGIAGVDDSGQVSDEQDPPSFVDAARVMARAVNQINFIKVNEQFIPAAMESESGNIGGSCGGSASYSIQIDTDTGSFSGSMSFNGYCNDGVYLTGETTFSGSINLSTNELESFTFNFDYITGTSGTESITMDGQIKIVVSGSSFLFTMNMLIRDNNANLVFKIQNYQINITDRGGYNETYISGRFYDPNYGYVDITTTLPLLIEYFDEYPYSGQIIITGEVGVDGGHTKARFTALSSTQCRVEADTTGNGVYDYDSGPILWTELGAGDGGGTALNFIEVTDDIDVPTTWITDNVYLIRKWDFYVNSTLTIQPGTVIKFHPTEGPYMMMSGAGVVNAIGTLSSPIIFTSYKDDANGRQRRWVSYITCS